MIDAPPSAPPRPPPSISLDPFPSPPVTVLLRDENGNPVPPAGGTTKLAFTPLDPTAPMDAAFLKGIQGNILKAHGRRHTRLILFRFSGAMIDASYRRLLADAVSDQNEDPSGTRWRITSAYDQWEAAKNKESCPHRPFYGLGLTYLGLRRCDFLPCHLPVEMSQDGEMVSTAFGGPMNDLKIATEILGDTKGDAPPYLPDWDPVYRDGIDGMFTIANNCPIELAAMEQRVTAFLTAHAAIKVGVENGFRWTDENHQPREPFGFRDGISDPVFFDKDCKRLDPADPSTRWVPRWTNIPRGQILFETGDHSGGSLLVLRKLEQNVAAFRRVEADIQQAIDEGLLDRDAKKPSQAGALLVGRERDGTALAESSPPVKGEKGVSNRFDFGTDQSRCPFHAHIRKAAPRVVIDPNEDNPHPMLGMANEDTKDAIEALFVRRSVIFDPYAQLPPSGTLSDRDTAPKDLQSSTYTNPNGKVITGHVGLLFMGYMSNIRLQFQEMQMDWFNNPDFPFRKSGVVDPVMRHQGEDWCWPGLPEVKVKLAQVVTPRGGAYFYVPSFDWLRRAAGVLPRCRS